MNTNDIERLVDRVRNGDVQAIARTISLIENEHPAAEALLNALFPYTGNAYRIGITGPPGAGKSTLTAQITRQLRKEGKTVGIIAVDPTSPFTGGAVLGDRIRMAEFATDPGVFIRSMASRGSMGGLARRTQDVGDVLDAAGKDVIIYETVGVGQTELDIAEAADTTVVVLVPESGDAIQTMKAGLMEIADIFVVNKSDREGAERIKIELDLMLQLRPTKRAWEPPIVMTVAYKGEGIEELMKKMEEHLQFLSREEELHSRRKKRFIKKVRELIRKKLSDDFWTEARREKFNAILESNHKQHPSPYEVMEKLFRDG